MMRNQIYAIFGFCLIILIQFLCFTGGFGFMLLGKILNIKKNLLSMMCNKIYAIF